MRFPILSAGIPSGSALRSPKLFSQGSLEPFKPVFKVVGLDNAAATTGGWLRKEEVRNRKRLQKKKDSERYRKQKKRLCTMIDIIAIISTYL
jgi:hypothetical protein